LSKLENFASLNGAKHYNMDINQDKIKLKKLNYPNNFQKILAFKKERIVIFEPDFSVFWTVEK
jgi:dihydroorotase